MAEGRDASFLMRPTADDSEANVMKEGDKIGDHTLSRPLAREGIIFASSKNFNKEIDLVHAHGIVAT